MGYNEVLSNQRLALMLKENKNNPDFLKQFHGIVKHKIDVLNGNVSEETQLLNRLYWTILFDIIEANMEKHEWLKFFKRDEIPTGFDPDIEEYPDHDDIFTSYALKLNGYTTGTISFKLYKGEKKYVVIEKLTLDNQTLLENATLDYGTTQ